MESQKDTTKVDLTSAYEQAQELAQPAEAPAATAEPTPEPGILATDEGLTEQGKLVQSVVVGEAEQPDNLGEGQSSDLSPEVEAAEEPDEVDSPLERFGGPNADEEILNEPIGEEPREETSAG
ncbi:MAG: hypothetical protein KME03_10695 [Aphanocapsa lilacina HA4352-LM1]|jgi:hypothetical protein|nr:hypothetical protein [Aphanocapsa lilacina HA4352-LM1]